MQGLVARVWASRIAIGCLAGAAGVAWGPCGVAIVLAAIINGMLYVRVSDDLRIARLEREVTERWRAQIVAMNREVRENKPLDPTDPFAHFDR